MADAMGAGQKPAAQDLGEHHKGGHEEADYVRIIPLPKIIFFYPTVIVGIICGIIMKAAGSPNLDNPTTAVQFAGWFFVCTLALNLMIITFDFNGVKFLALAFFVVAVFLGGILINIQKPDFFPFVGDILKAIRPIAMAPFFFTFSLILVLIAAIGIFVARATDVWYLRSNALEHKKGLLGDIVKYPTINLKVTKEIPDIFELLLLGSGSLVLQPTPQDRPIVLENVGLPWKSINKIEGRIRDLLSKWRIDAT